MSKIFFWSNPISEDFHNNYLGQLLSLHIS